MIQISKNDIMDKIVTVFTKFMGNREKYGTEITKFLLQMK